MFTTTAGNPKFAAISVTDSCKAESAVTTFT